MNGSLLFLTRRYLFGRRRGLGLPILSLVGLAVGVLTLNAVLSVMNGFQLTFIESLLELSSSHVRWNPPEGQPVPGTEERLRAVSGVKAVVPTTEGQTLISSVWGGRRGAQLRGFPIDTLDRDAGFARRLGLSLQSVGAPGLPAKGQVVLGSELARSLGVAPGDEVHLTSLTGPQFSILKPRVETLVVKGTFTSGYYEIDSSWVLASLDDTLALFAGPSDFFYAIKLNDGNADREAAAAMARSLGRPESEFTTWRHYNAAFFGALRTEKSVLIVLVGLIFLVVAVNLYFSQKRAVAERREDLALWAAVGVRPSRLRSMFAFVGLIIGALAALIGTVLGLTVAWGFGSLDLLSSDAFYLPALPSRVLPHEVILTAAACMAVSTLAAWLASAGVTRIPVAEVLKTA
jgi:lipoprotein-releasing system permease protein